MKLVTIHQPNYLPWPGFFHKWMAADAFVILDTVQYHKNEWQNRNRIKTANGAQWLTVPVSYRFPQAIMEISIHASPWARKQIAAIEQAYARAPFFDRYWPGLRAVLEGEWGLLRDLNIALIRELGGMLGCQAPLLLASDMNVETDDPTGRLIGLVRKAKGSAYLSGREGTNYLDASAFGRAGLVLYFQYPEAPVYPQLHGAFVSHLSVIDLLFNVGEDASAIVRQMGEVRACEES